MSVSVVESLTLQAMTVQPISWWASAMSWILTGGINLPLGCALYIETSDAKAKSEDGIEPCAYVNVEGGSRP